LTAQCTSIKPGGERCRGVAVRGSALCAAHHPDYQSQRRAGARRGGKAQANGELATLYADTIAGSIDKGRAAVGAQIQNVRLRAAELERRIKETEEFDERIEALERRISRYAG
jgi:hypothetical protein